MTVGLNLLHAHPGIGGAWNYIRNVVSAIDDLEGVDGITAYVTDQSAALVTGLKQIKPVHIRLCGTNRVARIAYEQMFLSTRAARDGVSVLHWFANTGPLFRRLPSAVTVYDLKVFEDGRDISRVQRAYLKAMIPFSARSASVLLPMSQKTADDIASRFAVPQSRMIVVPNPIIEGFRPRSLSSVAAFRAKYRLPSEFWVYVAHYYAHKNHERLLRAFASLDPHLSEAWPLVLRGNMHDAGPSLRRLADDLGIGNRVIWLPELSDDEMPLLYSAASALVFPSMYEGGGIPVMEAMACGCPITASALPTTNEFAGDSVLTFDPLSVEGIAASMAALQANPELRETLTSRALSRVEQFRPRHISELLSEAYRKSIMQ